MGLFSKRGRRARRKAEKKALKRRAAAEAKISTKVERARLRADLKLTKMRAKAQHKVDKAQTKALKAQAATFKAQEQAALKQAEHASRDRLSVSQVRKYLGIARTLTPVLAPLAYRGATYVRGEIEARRAQRLGVEVDQLSQFTGSGARLSARIAGAETSLSEIESRNPDDTETTRFVAATRARLADLRTAVQTAEPMPLARRRAAHQAISAELSGIEADLLARLGLN